MKSRSVLLAGLTMLVVVAGYFIFAQRHSQPKGRDETAAPSAANSPSGATNNSPAMTNAAIVSASAPVVDTNGLRQVDASMNFYAAGLREPGKSKRAWDDNFLKQHQNAKDGDPIHFELTRGETASGTVQHTQLNEAGELVYISGKLTGPETGTFFFLRPPPGGKAGNAAGVVLFSPGPLEFSTNSTAYRIEPTGPNGASELWERRVDEVVCVSLPKPPEAPLPAPAAETGEPQEIPPLRPDLVAGDYVPGYNSNIVSLQSYPGSSAVLLLDFFGGYTPYWGGVVYAKPTNVSNATIKDVWKRVAEDYMPFNINVTTDIQVYQNAPAASRQRVCYTDTPVTAAGVAYFGSWNWGTDVVCWSVYKTGKNGAEVGAHEAGHTLGLSHETQEVPDGNGGTNHVEYYDGHGSGVTGWAPIMGVGYYQPVATWSKGEFQYAGNLQNQITIIANNNNNVTFRADDTGSTLATSRSLEVYSDLSASAEGIIERATDVDAFQFTTTGGLVSLQANPVGSWANLALLAVLADSSDNIIASNNPQTTLYATITTNLPAGTYTFRVAGAGRNDPLTNGFSNYGSQGYYSIAGSVEGGRTATRLSVMEFSTNGTVVGVVPASNPNDSLDYTITSGNTGGTFSIDSSGVARVANNASLTYNQLATNSMFPVQFELLMNITNLSNPGLTELSRRVVISVLGSMINNPVAVTGFNARIIVPYNATPAQPKATGFDIPNSYCFYQAGLNGNPQVGGSGGLQGLPPGGRVLSPLDNSVFQLGPYGGTNALMMGNTYPTFGTLTLAAPQAYNSISILASSANGGGVGTFVLNFTNGTKSQVLNYNAQDWFNSVTNVAVQGVGRLQLGQATLVTQDNGASNPNIYQTTINLAALGLNQAIGSITFTNPPVTGSRSTAVFAISGSPMVSQPAFAVQPASTTNNYSSLSSSFNVVAMGTPPLSYQWYKGNPGGGTSIAGQTSSTFTINPVQTSDATNYFVIVTNRSGSVTSSVAALTVYRAPQITRQPNPTNLVQFAGESVTFSVDANAAVPVNYYWRSNGVFIPGRITAATTFNNLQSGNSADYTVIVSNSFGAVTSLVVSLTVVSPAYSFAQSALADNPIGYWRLDETSGTIAHDYANTNNGSFTNVTLGQPGNSLLGAQTSARFTNGAAANSYVGAIPIDLGSYTNRAFTIEAWVKGGSQSAGAGIVTKGTGAGGEQFTLDCGGAGNGYRFFFRDRNRNDAQIASSSVTPNNNWQHVVGICNEFNGFVALYINGALITSNAIPGNGDVKGKGSGVRDSANWMTIGARQSGTTTYNNQFSGWIQDVVIYDYALSPARILAHYSASTSVTLLTSDAVGTSSFTGSTNWNNGQSPGVGNVYFTGANTIRTTNVTTGGLTFGFAGDSLSIETGGRLLGKIGNNVSGNTTAGTINGNFVLNGGYMDQAGSASDSSILTVAGSVTVKAPSGLGALGAGASGGVFETLEIAAPISGSQALQVSGTSVNTGNDTGVVMLSAANPYGGTITVTNANNKIVASSVNRILQLNHLNALSNATLNLVATAANPVSFASASNTAAFNVGALAGSSAQALADTAGNAVALNVGGNNAGSAYSGALTGNGSLTKTGLSSLALSGANTFSGGVDLQAGTLAIGNNSALGTGLLNFNGGTVGATIQSMDGTARTITNAFNFDGGAGANTVFGGQGNLKFTATPTANATAKTLTVNNPQTEFSGTLNGAGTRTVAGTGTLILSGANTYSQGTTINPGATLQLGNGGTSGSLAASGAIVNDGTLKFNRSDVLVQGTHFSSAPITGAGSLIQAGTGTTILNATNTGTGGTTISGGALQLGDGSSRNGVVPGDITNNAMLVFANPLVQTFPGVIRGSGSLNKLGAGRLTLLGANTYNGDTTISGGTLALSGSGSLGVGTNITLANGAILEVVGRPDQKLTLNSGWILSGNGSIAGNMQADAGSVVSPGTGVGTLSVNGNATLGGQVIMDLDRTGVPSCDRLNITGTIVASGVLTVTNLGTALQSGDRFQLFGVPVTGFAAVNLPPLDSGLVWLDQLASAGFVAVVKPAFFSPTNVQFAVGPAGLTLTWPADHLGWRLQTQTNPLVTGLNSNWFDVAGATSTNQMTLPVSSDAGAVFFRLMYP